MVGWSRQAQPTTNMWATEREGGVIGVRARRRAVKAVDSWSDCVAPPGDGLAPIGASALGWAMLLRFLPPPCLALRGVSGHHFG